MGKKSKIENKIIVFILLIVPLFIITMLSYLSFAKLKSKVADSITYNENASITPYVCLISNSYISDTCSSASKSYVTSLINNINLNLKFNISSSNVANYNYSYVITAKVTANEAGDTSKIVYEKSYILDQDTAQIKSTNNMDISKNVNLDFKQYNSIINEFKKQYVLALDSNVTVSAQVKATAKYKNLKDMNVDKTLNIIIPLTEQTVNITRTDATYHNNETKIQYNNISDYKRIAVFINALFVIDLVIIASFIGCVVKSLPKRRYYTKKVDRILKEYDRAIVKVKHLPSLKNHNIIFIDSFTELLDAKDNLNEPILFKESKARHRAVFIVLTTNEAYVYSFSDKDEVIEEQGVQDGY